MSQVIGSPPGQPPEWTLLANATLGAGSTGIDVTGLPAYDLYRVDALLNNDGAGTPILVLRLNGDSAANYGYSSNATTWTAADTFIDLGMRIGSIADSEFIQLLVKGKTNAQANGTLNVAKVMGAANAGGLQFSQGNWKGGNATQVTRINILNVSSGTFTGKYAIYGKNMP